MKRWQHGGQRKGGGTFREMGHTPCFDYLRYSSQLLWMCSSLKHPPLLPLCVCVCRLRGGTIMWITEMLNWISRESLAPLVSVVSIDLYQKTPLTPLTLDTTGSHYISQEIFQQFLFVHAANWAVRHSPQSKVEVSFSYRECKQAKPAC